MGEVSSQAPTVHESETMETKEQTAGQECTLAESAAAAAPINC